MVISQDTEYKLKVFLDFLCCKNIRGVRLLIVICWQIMTNKDKDVVCSSKGCSEGGMVGRGFVFHLSMFTMALYLDRTTYLPDKNA